ncbi:hypothetical protein N7931_02535 [Catenovulum sp. 2E275]|uniref:hypothetical protein n=1 Tax=Catenovulum sp. 2E275 TaxID=2980497 RepID=UPI0021D3CD9F|nr:hypothetical protein [Catenovulum sp. 2E275]MCU4674499.1 hypothetical protein [Catenovulum sp. 2E275]
MKIKTIVSAILLAGAFSGQAYAVDAETTLEKHYQYLGLGIDRVSTDDVDYSVNALSLRLGALLNKNLYYAVELESMEDDMGEDNITISSLKADIGARYQYSDLGDVYVSAGWDASLVDVLGGEQDEVTDVNLEFGSHYALVEHFILGANLAYVVPEGADNHFAYGLDATVFIGERFSYTMGFTSGDGYDSYGLDISLHF